MKVLCSGASGFIGRYVCERLLAQGHEVLALDHHDRAQPWPLGVEVFYGDVRDEVSVTEAMAHADSFIHLAAVLGTQETIQNPRPAALSNLMGGLNMLEAAAQYDLPGVYICVGNHWMQNTYSITKTMIERFVRMFNADRGTSVNMVRCVNAYGPRQLAAAPYGTGKVRKITPAFVCRALWGDPIEIYGDGQQVSDMVYVGDVAKTLVAALECARDGPAFDQVIECGPRESMTVLQVAETVRDLTAAYMHKPPVDIVHLPMRPGEIAGDRVTADTSTLKLVGIDPGRFMPLVSGLQDTIVYFAKEQGIR